MVRVPKLARAAAALCLLAFLPACPSQPARLNAPPQGDALNKAESHTYFAYMSDQALLEDMSLADMHFIPHQAVLSGAGQARVERYVELLTGRGGTIAYDSQLSNEKLIQARIATVRKTLDELAPNGTQIAVVTGMAGGRGMDSNESLLRRRQMLLQGTPGAPGSAGRGGSPSGGSSGAGGAPGATAGASSGGG